KLAFNYLRTKPYFFNSLIGKSEDDTDTTYSLINKYFNNKIDNVDFYFITFNDDAEWNSNAYRFGFNLLTDNNVQFNYPPSIFSMININTSRISVSDMLIGDTNDENGNPPAGYHDFPTTKSDKDAMISS